MTGPLNGPVSPEQPVVLTGEFLRTHVADLAWEWARRGLGIGPDDPPVSEFDTDVPVELQRVVRLKLLAVLEQIRVTAETQARDTARLAARAGADYGDLGDAVGMTRQGARRRWPGLAEVTKAARTAAAAPGAVPPFRFEIYVPNAVAGAIVGHLVAAGYTGREAVQGAAGVHIGLPDRAGADGLRQRLADAGYRPGDVTEP